MEERVPLASGPMSRRPRTTDASPSSRIRTQQVDDDERESRRRRFNPSLLLSPTYLLHKIILVLNIVLTFLLFPVRKVVNLLLPPGEFDNLSQSAVSNGAAKAFIKSFTAEYITPLQKQQSEDDDSESLECPFVEKGYTATVNDIANQGRLHEENGDENPPPPLLLIYVHSPLHGKVPSFLKKTFCNPRVLSLLNQHTNSGTLTCWGGSIHTADGANAMKTLQASSFPFLSLVRVESARNSNSDQTSVQRKVELLFRMEGPALQNISPNSLHSHLSNSLVKYQAILSEAAMKRLQRQEEIRLREEQDREYREALEADQRREREKLEQQRLKEEEERRMQEEIEKAETERLNKIDFAKRTLSMNGDEEPDPNDKSIKQARIRLMLPSGKRLDRRFRGDDTIDVVRSFLILHFHENDVGIENFQLSSNYPKKTLADGSKTLEEEDLCPQAVIMVQDLDA
ncbi:hypothetical protein CTEN210_16848 [Chaetoceros tenuissimus]|uniref:UBX domain-containing protein n=1 Tax=Chaetoceros tenuissimus TaxID=426638 RepID=A0AAD3D9G1_9STRA|nr:hypothetical protein CTEN210_16848 [Chaetoceros tenuissimus]